MAKDDWVDRLEKWKRETLVRARTPTWSRPMLATLTDERFSDPGWIFERKLDGERCLVVRRKDRASIFSRNRKNLDGTYPELLSCLARQDPSYYVADGEIVAFSGKVTSFSRLQGRIGITDPNAARRSGIKVYLYLFDLLYLDGYDITGLPLYERRRLLRHRFNLSDPLRITVQRNRNGEKFYRRACKSGWEGLIAKRSDSTYVHGRSRDWLKFKCVNRQELVIGGYTAPRGHRTGFGALLLGYFDHGKLRYAGKVGTGFDEPTLDHLGRMLRARARKRSPYADSSWITARDARWVKPELVAEIGFTEWTRDGRLRHPRYLGLRRDKDAEDVVREAPG